MTKNCLCFISRLLAVLGVFVLEVLVSMVSSAAVEKTVSVGESVSIPCPLSSPGGSVQWLQNGKPIVLDTSSSSKRRHWNVAPDGTASLTILDVQRSDAGTWDCRELRSDGSVRNVAKVLELVVGTSPADPYLELESRRLVHQAMVTAREPQRLSVKCVAEGAVPPVRKIHWFVGEANLTSESDLFVEFSPDDEAYVSRSVLILNITRRLHKKELVCQVQHVTWLQAAAVSASLNVLYDPSFSISREPGFGFPIMEGMRVSLKCEVDANPFSEPLWVRDDGPLSVKQDEHGFLNFTPIGPEHTGWYRCTTQHEFGHFASFGYFLNVRSTDLPVSTSPEGKVPGLGQNGNGAAVNCIADGRPEVIAVNKSLMAIAGKSALLAGQLCSSTRPLRVHWILRHLVLNPGDVKYPYIAYNMSETEMPDCFVSALEIKRVKSEDAGELLLVVKNAKGIADATFLINVTQASFSVSRGYCGWRYEERYCCSSFPFLLVLPPLCLVWLAYSVFDECHAGS